MRPRSTDMSEVTFRVGEDRVTVYTLGSILIMTSGRRRVQVAIAHGDSDITVAPTARVRSADWAREWSDRRARASK